MNMPNKPAHISHTHCQAAQASRTSQSLSKSLSFPAHERKKRKHESKTLAICNAGECTDMKSITLNKYFGKRKVKCLEIPHYAF
tara:strand:- start:163 stop:414 length:252 start_codon:yes stop_codon:yes gene_type:complete